MRTISCRPVAAILEILEAQAIPIDDLVADLDVDLSYLRAGREQIEWEQAAIFFQALDELVGGRRELERIGEKLLHTEIFSRVRVLLSELSDAWQLYRVVRFWLVPSILPGASRRMHERPDGSIEFIAQADGPFIPAGPYIFLLVGLFRTLPTLIGEAPAQVTIEYDDARTVYLIVPPQVDLTRKRARQSSETGAIALVAVRELIDQQFDLQTTWLEQYRHIEALTERNRRTEAFNRLSQALAERLEVDSLVRVILAVMLVDFGFNGAVLELTINQSDTQRWGTGEREYTPVLTYPFAVAGHYRGRLELWGETGYQIGDEDDPVAMIMPWLTLALTNAVTFHNLDTERRRSEERLNALIEARDEILNSENKYRTLVEEASDAIVVFSAQTYQILEVNRALCQMLNYSREELLSMRMYEVLEPRDIDSDTADMRNLMRGQTVRTTRTALSQAGEHIGLECASRMLDEDRIQLIARDVTQWEAAKERIRESEERYAIAVRGAADGIWDWNLRTSEIYLSPRWKTMLGYDEYEIGTNPDEWLDRIHPEDMGAVRDAIDRHINAQDENLSVEHRIRSKSGEWVWVHARGLAVRDATGHAVRMAGSQTNITERKNFEKQLYHAAFHDTLTGLPNRAWCNDWLIRRLSLVPRTRFGLLYFDLDRFKVVNDSLGHIFGDQILREVAQRLQLLLPHNAFAARIGGDEFVVLVDAVADEDELLDLAEAILDIFSTPFQLEGRNFVLSCSIGIATSWTNAYDRPEQLMRDADLAMYKAKTSGQGGIRLYSEQLYTTALSKMQLEVALRDAIENDELELWYQPIVHGKSGRIVGAEGLARWPNGRPGGISPEEFIPLAEESGLIHPLAKWAIEKAAKQYRSWVEEFPDHHDLRVSVNLSPSQFHRDDIVRTVEHVIEKYQIPPYKLVLEITESALIEDSEQAIDRILALRELGADVVIDDLGTGYSPLAYLVRLPIQLIKIDRSFLINVENDATKNHVATALLRLASSLGKQVVAEGVETEAARQIVVEISPDAMLQGYLFSPPVSAVDFSVLLKKRVLP